VAGLGAVPDDAGSVAGYHKHFVSRASAVQWRHLSDDALLVHIKVIHTETHNAYGWPRTRKELLARGIPVVKEQVQMLTPTKN